MTHFRKFIALIIIISGFQQVVLSNDKMNQSCWDQSTFVPSFPLFPSFADVCAATFNYGIHTAQSLVQNPKVAWSVAAAAVAGAGIFSWCKTKKCEADILDIKLRYTSSAVTTGKKLSLLNYENNVLKSENQTFRAAVTDITYKFPINENLLKRSEHLMIMRNWRQLRD